MFFRLVHRFLFFTALHTHSTSHLGYNQKSLSNFQHRYTSSGNTIIMMTVSYALYELPVELFPNLPSFAGEEVSHRCVRQGTCIGTSRPKENGCLSRQAAQICYQRVRTDCFIYWAFFDELYSTCIQTEYDRCPCCRDQDLSRSYVPWSCTGFQLFQFLIALRQVFLVLLEDVPHASAVACSARVL